MRSDPLETENPPGERGNVAHRVSTGRPPREGPQGSGGGLLAFSPSPAVFPSKDRQADRQTVGQ